MMPLTPAYAALFAFIFIVLSARTIILRGRFKIGIGWGDEPMLERAMRAHANFAEYVPFAILLVFFLETQLSHPALIHSLYLTLLLGRLLHAYGISQAKENHRCRVIGMIMTFSVIVYTSSHLLLGYANSLIN